MYRTSCETNLKIFSIVFSSLAFAAIAAFVLARCGAQRSQYHFEISGQSADVETRMFCTCV